MLEQQCSVEVHVRSGVALVAVAGELDIATIDLLREHLTHLERTDVNAILLDLREVTFLDCSAIRVFLRAHDHAKQNGHRFILVGANALAQRVMELTSTQFLLREDGTTDVLARFTRPDSADSHQQGVSEVGPGG